MAGSQISTSVTIINSLLGFQALSLTASNPSSIAAGSKVEIAGAFFTFTANETINASSWTAIATGVTAYLNLTPSGTAGSQILSAAWDTTAPVWSTSKQGWYSSTSSNIRIVAAARKTDDGQGTRVILTTNQYDKQSLQYVDSFMDVAGDCQFFKTNEAPSFPPFTETLASCYSGINFYSRGDPDERASIVVSEFGNLYTLIHNLDPISSYYYKTALMVSQITPVNTTVTATDTNAQAAPPGVHNKAFYTITKTGAGNISPIVPSIGSYLLVAALHSADLSIGQNVLWDHVITAGSAFITFSTAGILYATLYRLG